MLDDPLSLLPHEVLRERLPVLVRESCAWAVGLSDRPHHVRRHGRTVPSGVTLGARAATGHSLSVDEDGRFELGDARPGSFRDALNALTGSGDVLADRYDAEVLRPFVDDTCVVAAQRAREQEPEAWDELLDDLGEDGTDLLAVARAAEWDTALRGEAEDLALAALGDVPLVEVESEGLPLSVVRAAERSARAAVPAAGDAGPDDGLDAVRFLAQRALADAALELPVPPEQAGELLRRLTEFGLEPEEVRRVLDDLPVRAATADSVVRMLAAAEGP